MEKAGVPDEAHQAKGCGAAWEAGCETAGTAGKKGFAEAGVVVAEGGLLRVPLDCARSGAPTPRPAPD